MKKGDLVSELSLLKKGYKFKRLVGNAEEYIKGESHLYWSRKTESVIEVFGDESRYATH